MCDDRVVSHPGRAEGGNWFTCNFIDPEDSAFDVSPWLDRGGFIPRPIIITEPTVDNGFGLAGVFIHGVDDDTENLPNVSGIARAHTGNESWPYAGFHQGSYFEDRLRYTGAIGQTSLNLDVYSHVAPQIAVD